ncbi:hypothetical protein ACERZ8_21425 [Tateyamaria armeniaca]|uniref:Uncharacterized protein n=1 Tax=Tateyamaria armeniaca TaxID=2518930 RepID=A0ABW8V2S5_9RHOB
MADIALKGPELKKMVKIAKKRDLNFAYCPGNDPKEDVFVLDRKKKPEVMGRVARAEGTGAKLGLGTARAKGRIMMMTCTREMPQMAKKLKKFLKFEKIPMNVIIMDKDGNIIEEDIEDLPEDPELDSDDVDEEVLDEQRCTEAEDDTAPDASENGEETVDDGARLKQLTTRAGQVKTSIAGLAAEPQAAMNKHFAIVLGALKSSDLDKADDTLTKLETALGKLAAKGNDAGPDPELERLREESIALLGRVEALGNAEGASRLMGVHKLLVDQIDAGNVKKATGTAKALNEAITRLEGQGADTAEAAENQADTNDAQPEGDVDLGAHAVARCPR